MPDFPNLPAILRWEISLALLVLAWSLLSLGRYERLKRRWRRGRSTAPVRFISRGEPVRVDDVHPQGRARARRPHRLKVLAAAAGFASVAASVAYAMPNIVHLDQTDASGPSAPKPQPQEPRSPRPQRVVEGPVAPPAQQAVEERVEAPTRRPSDGHHVTVTVETEMVTSAATGMSDPPPTAVVAASSPTPEPSVDPTPAPVVTPTPTASAPPDAMPSPDPTE